MKKSLLLLAALGCITMVQAAPTAHQHKMRGQRSAQASNLKWLPGTITYYYWNDWDTNDWQLSYETKLTYNDNSWKTSESSDNSTTTYEYNDRGDVILAISSYNGEESSKTEYGYDEVTHARISEIHYQKENDQWVKNYGENRRITRNEAGNIIKVEDYYFEEGHEFLSSYYEIKYGTDGKAVEMINYDVDDDDTEIEFHLTDIVWERTNGQILIDDNNDMDIEDYFVGNNCVKSGTLIDFDEDKGVTAYVVAEYPDNMGSVTVTFTIDGQVAVRNSLTVLDEYGSYKEEEYEHEYSCDSTGKITWEDEEYNYTTTETFDAYGICLSYLESDRYRESKGITTVTYDDTYGYPLEAVVQTSYNDSEPQNSQRTVYSDYASFSGIAEIVADENAPIEFFTLQGVRVTNPTTGLYIRRQGANVSKVLIK